MSVKSKKNSSASESSESLDALNDGLQIIKNALLENTEIFPNKIKFENNDAPIDSVNNLDLELEIIKQISLSSFPKRNVWDISRNLGVSSAQISDIVQNMENNNILEIVLENNVEQIHLKDNNLFERELKEYFDLDRVYAKIDGFDETAQRLVGKFVDAVEAIKQKRKNPHPLPEVAPELYEDRSERDESVRDFIARVYDKWLDGTLARPDLRRLDKKAYQALANWERRFGRVDYSLPTLKEKNDQVMIESFITADADLELFRRRIHSMRSANATYNKKR